MKLPSMLAPLTFVCGLAACGGGKDNGPDSKPSRAPKTLASIQEGLKEKGLSQAKIDKLSLKLQESLNKPNNSTSTPSKAKGGSLQDVTVTYQVTTFVHDAFDVLDEVDLGITDEAERVLILEVYTESLFAHADEFATSSTASDVVVVQDSILHQAMKDLDDAAVGAAMADEALSGIVKGAIAGGHAAPELTDEKTFLSHVAQVSMASSSELYVAYPSLTSTVIGDVIISTTIDEIPLFATTAETQANYAQGTMASFMVGLTSVPAAYRPDSAALGSFASTAAKVLLADEALTSNSSVVAKALMIGMIANLDDAGYSKAEIGGFAGSMSQSFLTPFYGAHLDKTFVTEISHVVIDASVGCADDLGLLAADLTAYVADIQEDLDALMDLYSGEYALDNELDGFFAEAIADETADFADGNDDIDNQGSPLDDDKDGGLAPDDEGDDESEG